VLNFINDKKAPKTCKNLYKYLLNNGYYDKIETRLNTHRKEKQ
jgi:cyclophilin family peptidyl-prolyl cis-trans isomerase